MNNFFSLVRKLEAGDPVDDFDCGQQDLNSYLKQHAWNNQRANGAQTYVACVGSAIAGYFTLCAGSVDYVDAPPRIAKGLGTIVLTWNREFGINNS